MRALRSTGLRAHARDVWGRLRGGELTPTRAAASVAVGLFVGVTPLYGLHLFIVLGVCLPLRLDARVAYLAANISLPFIAPLLSLAEIQMGAWVRTGHALALDVPTLRARGVSAFAADLGIGAAMFAPASAAMGGALTYVIAALVMARTPFDEAVRRVGARYRGRGARFHVKAKLSSDPVARAVLALEPLGEVCDVGCGRGQLGLLLLDGAKATGVWGVDWDASKVTEASGAGDGLAAHFEKGDVRSAAIPACDTVLLIDALHYLGDAEQDALLLRAASAARHRVVVRELDPDRGWRSAVTRAQEAVTTTLRFNRGAQVRVRPIAAIARVLEGAGFAVSVTPCWEGTPFANVLVVARRGASSGS